MQFASNLVCRPIIAEVEVEVEEVRPQGGSVDPRVVGRRYLAISSHIFPASNAYFHASTEFHCDINEFFFMCQVSISSHLFRVTFFDSPFFPASNAYFFAPTKFHCDINELFFKYVSIRPLNMLTLVALFTFSGRLFHTSATLTVKKFFRRSK